MGYSDRGMVAQVRAVAGVITIGLLLAMCIISSTSIRQGGQRVVLEGLSSGGEYEDGKALDAGKGFPPAIAMAVSTNQTDILDYPDVFNGTLSTISGNVAEASQAMAEGEAMQGVYESYTGGTDPW